MLWTSKFSCCFDLFCLTSVTKTDVGVMSVTGGRAKSGDIEKCGTS